MTPPAILDSQNLSENLYNSMNKPCVLVVDDQATNIQVLYQILNKDYQILKATSGTQAMALVENKHPDLILLDLIMPDMDGYQVCQKLKTNPATRDIPVIFITAQNDEAAEERGFDLGAVDFIAKPINPRIVKARLKTHLTLKAQSDLLRSWAYMDGLTGVHNRRFFDERLAAEYGRAVRNHTALSILMLDVDFFKRYNDKYGHQAGDDCLRQVATTLKNCLTRASDHIARYGGEEFVCLLPETNFVGALQIAEQIRSDIMNQYVPHEDSSVAPFITVSIGVGCKPELVHGSANSLLSLADAQLYQAKAEGRHRTCGAQLEDKK
jgi:diguanylate cyclase (GGDEF)-like protein